MALWHWLCPSASPASRRRCCEPVRRCAHSPSVAPYASSPSLAPRGPASLALSCAARAATLTTLTTLTLLASPASTASARPLLDLHARQLRRAPWLPRGSSAPWACWRRTVPGHREGSPACAVRSYLPRAPRTAAVGTARSPAPASTGPPRALLLLECCVEIRCRRGSEEQTTREVAAGDIGEEREYG
jgi:hypothetical protein